MPYISDKLKIGNKKLDRRVKLQEKDREDIRELYTIARVSLRGIARKYHVDKKTIKFIVDPSYYQQQLKKYSIEKHSQKYYVRENHTKSVREHRRYKYSLYKKGMIEERGVN